MKRILILITLFMLGSVSMVLADSSTDSSDKGAVFMQINGDTSYPTAAFATQVNQGWGGEGSIGYRFPMNLEVAVESGYDTYSTKNGNNSGTFNVVPLVLKLQYNVGNFFIKPYLFIAGGLSFDNKSPNYFNGQGATSETDFLEEGGLGLSFTMASGTVFFVQSKIQVNNTSSAYASDVPTITFPINVGLQFSLD